MTKYEHTVEMTSMNLPNPNPRFTRRWAPLAAILLTVALPAAWLVAAPAPATAAKAPSSSRVAQKPAVKTAPASLAQIWRVAVEKKPAETVINLETLPSLPQYSHFTLRHPDRWVLDFQATADAMPRHRWTEKTKNLADIRVGQFQPGVARVVLDLHRAVTPKITPLAHGLKIVIPDGPAPAVSVASAALKPAASPVAAANAKKLAAARQAAQSAWHPAKTVGQASRLPAPAPLQASAPPPADVSPAPAVSHLPSPAPRETEAMNRPPVVPSGARAEASTASAGAGPTGAATGSTEANGGAESAGETAVLPTAVSASPRPLASVSPGPASRRPIVPAPSDSVAAAAHIPYRVPSSVTPRGVAPESLRLPINQAIQGINPGNGEPTVYTGERITLNLKDASLTDFFRLINQISGLNIIVDPSVHGSVTMVLQDVPWDQALDLVLRNNSLGRKLEGNVLYIATEKTLEAQDEEIASLQEAREAAAPLVTKVMPLSYAKASDVAKIISAKNFVLGKRETISVDPRTNALILHVHPTTLPAIDALVARLDQRTPQVEIRAKVVSASREFIRELGVQLGFGAGNAASEVGGLNSVGSGQTALNIAAPKYATNNGLLPLNLNLGATAPTSGIGFINASSSFRLDAMLSAAEQKGLGHVLSQPKIITQNNMQASVAQGVRLPVQTTINNTISVQFFNVTLNLTVTPQITADHHIFLNVSVTNDAIDNGIPPVNGVPAIDTESATTNVLVANGSTVVIGGVMVNNNQNSVFQVPLLGSIPVIGNLFKHTVINNQTQELLFFITPTIIGS